MTIALFVLQVALIVSVTLGYVILNARKNYWKEQFLQADNEYTEVFDRAIAAEGDKARAEVELNYLKNTIGIIASRNAIAILTDDQVNVLVNAISQLILANLKPNNQLN